PSSACVNRLVAAGVSAAPAASPPPPAQLLPRALAPVGVFALARSAPADHEDVVVACRTESARPAAQVMPAGGVVDIRRVVGAQGEDLGSGKVARVIQAGADGGDGRAVQVAHGGGPQVFPGSETVGIDGVERSLP